jgi:hypothetical protein
MPKCLKSYKDKKKAIAYNNRNRKNNYLRGNFILDKTKRPRYKKEEDYIVIHSNLTDREIAKSLCRSVISIQIRRWRLKKENLL